MAMGFPVVVKEIEFRQLHQYRFPVMQIKSQFAAAAHNLLGRNAIDLLREGPHELDAAAGHNQGLEAVRTQIGK
jgi:hypothetical protein